jgi:hypothetical protein
MNRGMGLRPAGAPSLSQKGVGDRFDVPCPSRLPQRWGTQVRSWCWALAAALAALAGLPPAAAQEHTPDDWTRSDHQRIVKVFDFDEPDNLGTIPKFWELFPGEAFPHFADGRFDRTVGRTAPPSF